MRSRATFRILPQNNYVLEMLEIAFRRLQNHFWTENKTSFEKIKIAHCVSYRYGIKRTFCHRPHWNIICYDIYVLTLIEWLKKRKRCQTEYGASAAHCHGDRFPRQAIDHERLFWRKLNFWRFALGLDSLDFFHQLSNGYTPFLQ